MLEHAEIWHCHHQHVEIHVTVKRASNVVRVPLGVPVVQVRVTCVTIPSVRRTILSRTHQTRFLSAILWMNSLSDWKYQLRSDPIAIIPSLALKPTAWTLTICTSWTCFGMQNDDSAEPISKRCIPKSSASMTVKTANPRHFHLYYHST